MKKSTIAFAALALAWLVSAASVASAQWGDLKIVFKADKAVAPKFASDVANANCGVQKVALEEVVVDPKSLGIANVVVFLDDKGDKPKIHPNYNALKAMKVTLDNNKCRFEPHIASLWTEQTLTVKNSDPVGHNSKVDAFDNKSINPVIPPGGSVDANFTNPESLPMTVSCNIHRWMKGYIVVKDHPYVGVSDTQGTLIIKDLPAGEVDFRAWHETGYVSDAKIGGKDAKWKKGRFSVKIPNGGMETIEVEVPTASLK